VESSLVRGVHRGVLESCDPVLGMLSQELILFSARGVAGGGIGRSRKQRGSGHKEGGK